MEKKQLSPEQLKEFRNAMHAALFANLRTLMAAALDQINADTGKTHCIQCADGDPTGQHAIEERMEKAFLGVVIRVAEEFYGPYLNDKAKFALAELKAEALPADAAVS